MATAMKPSTNQTDVFQGGLMDLPLEIVQMVADCLHTPDAASFALSNRTLSTFLGSTYWKFLGRDRAEASQRKQFLTTIARDIPLWFLCRWCSNLHPRDRVGPPGPAFQPRHPLHCIKEQRRPLLWTFLHVHRMTSTYDFGYHYLQLAMERHRLSVHYGLSTDSLSFVEIEEPTESGARQRLTTLLSIDARVCANPEPLGLRIQNCAVCNHKDLELVREQLEIMWVCHHLKHSLPSLLEYLIICGANAAKLPKIQVQQYISCNMDYQLEIDDFGRDGLVLVVTKWLDLGSGTGLVQQTVDTAARSPILSDNLVDWCEGTSPSSQPGEILSSFEREQGGLSQQALILRNRSYLTGERYKKEMSRWYHGIWIWQANQRIPNFEPSDRHIDWLLALGLLWSTFICWCMLGRLYD